MEEYRVLLDFEELSMIIRSLYSRDFRDHIFMECDEVYISHWDNLTSLLSDLSEIEYRVYEVTLTDFEISMILSSIQGCGLWDNLVYYLTEFKKTS